MACFLLSAPPDSLQTKGKHMNTIGKDNLKLWHSPASYAVAGHGQDIYAAVEHPAAMPADELPPRLELTFTPCGGAGETRQMTPFDSFVFGDRAFEIYSAHIPAAKVNAGTLKYSISACGQRRDCSLEVTTLPAPPPMIITEMFIRAKGAEHAAYVELYAVGGADVDLYDWELILTSEQSAPARYPLALERETILHAGETAVWWPVMRRNFNVDKSGRDSTTPADLCADLNSMYYPPVPAADPDRIRIIPIKYAERDADGTVRVNVDAEPLPYEYNPWRLSLVPRGGELSDAVYTLDYNTVWGCWDAHVRRSSEWGCDLRHPSRAVNIRHNATDITPGVFSARQAVPDADTPSPLILPLSPDGEIYIGDEKHEILFAATVPDGDGKVTAAWADVITDGDGGCVRLDATAGDDGLWHAAIPRKLIERMARLEYSLGATNGTRETVTSRFSVAVFDNAGPRIISMRPTPRYAYDIGGDLEISASYFDISGVRLSECRMLLDERDVTAAANWRADGVSLDAPRLMSAGEHVLRLVLCDMLGNKTVRSVKFSVSDMSDLFAYHGEVHSHTSTSDGVGTPADAYRYARDVGGADYFAVTDHSHYILDDEATMEHMVETADEFEDPGHFAALYGYEMTWNMRCGYWGHMNVVGGSEIHNHIFTTTLPDLYEKISRDSTAVAMFNHPGCPWGNFDEFAYLTPGADERVCLSEIRDESYDGEYAAALAAGWHASPVSNEDNHAANWTTARRATGFVLAPALTRENIMDAFRARRTYTAAEPTLKIKYRVNGQWLGSRLNAPEKLDFDIDISTEDESGIGRIEIVAEDNIVVAVKNAGARRSIKWNPTLLPEFDYYYLRITAPGKYSVTSPVWVENRRRVTLGAIECGMSYNTRRGTAVRMRVTNPERETLRDVRAELYITRTSGLDIRDEEPYCVVHCGDLAAGRSVRVSRSVAEHAELHRLCVVITAEVDGARRAMATASAVISPVTITEVLPYSMSIEHGGKTIDDPYPYITLYNSSSREQELGGMALRLWHKIGKAPSEGRTWHIPQGVKVAPRSALVVWVRSEKAETAGLGIDDFNEYYKTAHREGEGIVVCNKEILSHSEFARRLELVSAGEVLSRVHWNYGMAFDGDAHRGRARRYLKQSGLYPTSTPIGMFDPAPGYVTDEQRTAEIPTAPARGEARNIKRGNARDKKLRSRREHLKRTNGETAALAALSAVAVGTAAALAALARSRSDR